jgi:lipopolysaccharide/colanic/teichoic acid biosynthesis glycosyltransferase
MVSHPNLRTLQDDLEAPLGLDVDTKEACAEGPRARFEVCAVIDSAKKRVARPLSNWSASTSKRLFDIGCVVFSLPLTLPILVLAGFAVRVTSRGPVLFRQQRMGCHGKTFTIYKFRTMPVRRRSSSRPVVTTAINQRFTPVGPFLRRWKLDELPQLFNVLRGDMSLVGPRPKVPSHQATGLNCRPGITGRATVVFAREEVTLANIPLAQLDTYYHGVVLPLKQILDDDYMAKATFASDMKLIAQSVFRRWEDLKLSDLLPSIPMPAGARSSVVRLDMPHHSTVLLPSQNAMASHPE